ncbi:MAG: nicotinate-nucleotide adenylyltransferase [Alphaproteobacteria bacterium]
MTFFTEPKYLDAQRWKNMRIGLLGGSFNPPHEAHIHISQVVLKALHLDAIWWLVTPLNPMKTPDNLLSIDHRIKRARQMIDHARIVVTGIESELDTQFSYATIKRIKQMFPYTDFAWIMGMDNVHQFHLWQHWKAILSEICMIHVARHPPTGLIQQCPLRMMSTQRHIFVNHAGYMPLDSHTSYWLLQKKMMKISSTEIREKNKILTT